MENKSPGENGQEAKALSKCLINFARCTYQESVVRRLVLFILSSLHTLHPTLYLPITPLSNYETTINKVM